MKKYALVATIAAIAGLVIGRLAPVQSQAQVKPATSWAAVPGEKGGADVWGPYQPQIGWPQEVNALPGHDPKWSWGSVEGIFAETPDRVYILTRGELPYNTAEVSMGRAQKFVPRRGANPEMLVGIPPKGAW